MKLRISVVLLSSMATGCVPLPHSSYLAPAVRGVVTSYGVPVRNVEVSVSTFGGDEIRKSVTDSDGRFATAPIKRAELFVLLAGDPLIRYSITISTAEKRYEGLNEGYVGYGPEKIYVACELSKPVQSQNEEQYCVSTDQQ